MKTETAKDLLKQILNTDLTLQYREKLIIEYAELKCSKQREICAKAHEERLKKYWHILSQKELQVEIDIIKNAPKPDFK